MCSKTLLFPGTLFEKAFSCFGLLGLQPTAQFSVALSQPVDLPAGIKSAVRVGSDIHDTQVNAEKFTRVARWRFFHLADLMKIELSIAQDKVGFAASMLQKLLLPVSGDEGDFEPAAGRPYRDSVSLPRKDALIVGNTAMPFELSQAFSVELIPVNNLRKHSHHNLGGQGEAVANVVVEKVVKVVLAKSLRLPRMLTDVVSGVVHGFKRVKQGLVLPCCRLELHLRNQLHSHIIASGQTFDKKGGLAHSSVG